MKPPCREVYIFKIDDHLSKTFHRKLPSDTNERRRMPFVHLPKTDPSHDLNFPLSHRRVLFSPPFLFRGN